MGRYLFLAGTILISAAVLAATPQELQKERHEHYEHLGDAFKAVRDGAKSSTPDWAAIEKAATEVQKASVKQEQWFTKGTGPEAGKTRALPEIWSDPTGFAAAAKLFEEKTPALVAAAKSKDADAVNKAFKEVGGSCKNCHDKYRAPEE